MPNPGTPNACTECFARGIICREQQATETYHSSSRDTRQNLRQRVAELENALLSISRRLETRDNVTQQEKPVDNVRNHLTSQTSPLTPASSVTTPPDGGLDNAPVFSLFNNAILSRRQYDEGPSSTIAYSAASTPKADRIANSKLGTLRQTLLSLFPSEQRLGMLLDAAYPWWSSWQQMLPETFGTDSQCSFSQFIADRKASGSVPELAKALLCISISLQETPVSAKSDVFPSSDMTSHCINIIDESFLSDDELAGTLDGIECLLLRSKHDSNNGRLRRAWITFRRAISFAQLLGCHLHSPQPGHSNEQLSRKHSIWNALYLSDRYLSLILGLPYCISEAHVHPNTSNAFYPMKTNIAHVDSDYLFTLARIVGHVIDRNQTPSPADTLIATVKTEAEMTDLAASMPKEWWVLTIGDGEARPLLYSKLLPQFWHHLTRALLHLPFMLKATTDRRYAYNRIAALESARSMISLFHIFRPIKGFGSLVCKIIDFQAFTAAMILVLNFLSVSPSNSASEVREADEDRELVSVTTSIMQRASLEAGGGVVTQAARALEMFTKSADYSSPAGQCTAKLAIPYFGTVVFGPGKSFANQSCRENRASQPQHQIPTPEEESQPLLDSDQWVPSTNPNQGYLDSNYDGFPLPQTQGLASNSDAFANIDLDLDGDWGWFWDNTQFPTGDILPSLG